MTNDTDTDETDRVGWFFALGNEVPQEQRDAAIREARKMGLDVPDSAQWVNEIATLVEQDCPKEAIETTREHLDLTGTYRFLAALCTSLEYRSVDAGTDLKGTTQDVENETDRKQGGNE